MKEYITSIKKRKKKSGSRAIKTRKEWSGHVVQIRAQHLPLVFSFLFLFLFSFVKLAFVTFGSALSRGWIKNGASCSRVLEPTHRCRLYTLADLFTQPLIVLLEFTIPSPLRFPIGDQSFYEHQRFRLFFNSPQFPLLPFVNLINFHRDNSRNVHDKLLES